MMTAEPLRTFAEDEGGGFIRRATIPDTPAMLRIVEDRIELAENLAKWPDWISLSLVYVLNAEVVGFVSRGVEPHTVHGLYVGCRFRRRGFGPRLLQEVEGLIKGDGKPLVRLFVETANVRAHNLYRRLGYRNSRRKTAAGWHMEKLFGEQPGLEDYPL